MFFRKTLHYTKNDDVEEAHVEFESEDKEGKKEEKTKRFKSLEDAKKYFESLPADIKDLTMHALLPMEGLDWVGSSLEERRKKRLGVLRSINKTAAKEYDELQKAFDDIVGKEMRRSEAKAALEELLKEIDKSLEADIPRFSKIKDLKEAVKDRLRYLG